MRMFSATADCPKVPANGFPAQFECDGAGAVAFYSGLLSFALYWNQTVFEEEGAMSVELPVHGIDVGNFAKHSVARMMITRRDMYHPRYGAPPLYYAACCDGFQDVFAADMATYLEWGMYPTAKGVLDNFLTYCERSTPSAHVLSSTCTCLSAHATCHTIPAWPAD